MLPDSGGVCMGDDLRNYRFALGLQASNIANAIFGGAATPRQIWHLRGKFEVNLPHMPPDFGGVCMGVDLRNHRFAPGLPPGWLRCEPEGGLGLLGQGSDRHGLTGRRTNLMADKPTVLTTVSRPLPPNRL